MPKAPPPLVPFATRVRAGDSDNFIRVFTRSGEASGDGDNGGGSWRQAAAAAQAHEQDVNSVRWNPADGALLASAGDDARVRLWRYEAAAGETSSAS